MYAHQKTFPNIPGCKDARFDKVGFVKIWYEQKNMRRIINFENRWGIIGLYVVFILSLFSSDLFDLKGLISILDLHTETMEWMGCHRRKGNKKLKIILTLKRWKITDMKCHLMSIISHKTNILKLDTNRSVSYKFHQFNELLNQSLKSKNLR